MRTAGARCRQLSAFALWGLVVLLTGAVIGVGTTVGQEVNHAGLVVVFEDGRSEARCVEFAEEEISGAELLRRSGLAVVFSSSGGFGEGVCRIDGTGCSDPGDCFCQCSGGDCAYWSYFSLQDGEWRYQNVGASQRRIRDGDVDGWVWGSGRTPPPEIALGDICPLSAPTVAPALPTAEERSQGERPSPVPETGEPVPPLVDEPVAQAEEPESAVLPAASPPSEVDGEVAVSGAGEERPTPPAQDSGDQALRSGEQPTVVGGVDGPQADTIAAEESGGGPPAGLIVFGLVAVLLAGAVGGLALRRRRFGD